MGFRRSSGLRLGLDFRDAAGIGVQESASRWRDRRRIEGEVKGLGKREGRGRGKGETDGVLMRWRVDFQSM